MWWFPCPWYPKPARGRNRPHRIRDRNRTRIACGASPDRACLGRRIEDLATSTRSVAREGVDVGERAAVDLGHIAHGAWEFVSPSKTTPEVAERRIVPADESRPGPLMENTFRNVKAHRGGEVKGTVELMPGSRLSRMAHSASRNRRIAITTACVTCGLLHTERVSCGHPIVSKQLIDGLR